MHWFRLYSEFATDPKVQRMPEEMQRRLVMIFCAKAADTIRTWCDADVTFYLRISDVACDETKKLFIERGFIDEQWNLLNWDKRQFVSDSSTERTKRYRERKRTSQNVTVTKCDALDTDTDTDTEHIKPKPIVRSAHLVEQIYELYPRKVGKGAALRAIKSALTKLQAKNSISETEAATILIRSVSEFARSPAGNRGEYTPHCSTWMNQQRWNDDRGEWHRDFGGPNGTQPINRSRTRQELQRMELERAEEMDSAGAFDAGDHDEGNRNGGSLKRLCESVGGPATTQVAKGIPSSRSNPEILPKASRTN